MVESFTIGVATAFMVRTAALRSLKWPLTSSKLIDYFRTTSIDSLITDGRHRICPLRLYEKKRT